jgi:hypothetical protein
MLDEIPISTPFLRRGRGGRVLTFLQYRQMDQSLG